MHFTHTQDYISGRAGERRTVSVHFAYEIIVCTTFNDDRATGYDEPDTVWLVELNGKYTDQSKVGGNSLADSGGTIISAKVSNEPS